MKKITEILIVLFVLLSLAGCQKQEKQSEDIYIVFTSDVHCGFETSSLTMPALKAYVDSLKSEHNGVLFVDCGDYIQGGTVGTMSKGQFVIDVMNEVGYDVVTIGNHEFDYGVERLGELLGELNCDVVVSNAKYSGNKQNIFADIPEYVIKEVNGVKVGFIGLLTPTTIITSTPSYFMEDGETVYDFYSADHGQELFNKAQQLVDEVRKEGAKYVIVLSHLGSNDRSGDYNSFSLIANTEGIDAVLDGHSHSVYAGELLPNKNGEDVLLCSVGTKLENAGTLIIDTEGNLSSVLVSEFNETDQETADLLVKINDGLEKILSQKVGETAFDLSIVDEEGVRIVRSRETNMGDLMADALRYYADTQIGIINGGGVRATISAGDITYKDLLDVAPFQNCVASIYASGQQILDYLEVASSKTERIYKLDGNSVGESGGFAQVSGLKYTIDTSKDAGIEYDENQHFKQFNSDERRVKDVYVLENDEYVPLDPEKIYTVGSINYLLFEPGDGNNILNNCEHIITQGITDVEVLKGYIEQFGVDEQYRTAGGRITIE